VVPQESSKAPTATRIERRFHRTGLKLAIPIALLGALTAVSSNLPDTYNPDHFRASRLSSINLNKCSPEPSLCIILGNGERFKFQSGDSEAALQWTRNRIESDYSVTMETLYWQSLAEGGRDLGGALFAALAVYAAIAGLGWALARFARSEP
jgi:hypothetical protein